MLSVLGGGNKQDQGKKRTKPKDGNVEVEFGPEFRRKKGKSSHNDGEYVEYEEVK